MLHNSIQTPNFDFPALRFFICSRNFEKVSGSKILMVPVGLIWFGDDWYEQMSKLNIES